MTLAVQSYTQSDVLIQLLIDTGKPIVMIINNDDYDKFSQQSNIRQNINIHIICPDHFKGYCGRKT